MSYMRFPVYVYTSASCADDLDCDRTDHEWIHLWPCRGEQAAERAGVLEDPDAYDRDGGIHIRQDLFDELVLCRYAELVEAGEVEAAARRVLDPNSAAHGNFGSWAALEAVGLDPRADFLAAMEAARPDSTRCAAPTLFDRCYAPVGTASNGPTFCGHPAKSADENGRAVCGVHRRGFPMISWFGDRYRYPEGTGGRWRFAHGPQPAALAVTNVATTKGQP